MAALSPAERLKYRPSHDPPIQLLFYMERQGPYVYKDPKGEKLTTSESGHAMFRAY